MARFSVYDIIKGNETPYVKNLHYASILASSEILLLIFSTFLDLPKFNICPIKSIKSCKFFSGK